MEIEKKTMKTVMMLLTKYASPFSRFICGISKNKYSHASISNGTDGESNIGGNDKIMLMGFEVLAVRNYKKKESNRM